MSMTLRPGETPLFANPTASVPDTYPGIVEQPTFDAELSTDAETTGQPTARTTARWRAVARLNAHGVGASIIAKRLKYSPAAVANLLANPWVQTEVQKFRESWDLDPNQRIKDAAIDSIDRIHAMVLDEGTNAKLALDASKFLLEKATGKAKQEINVESGTLMQYMEMLKGMQQRGETFEVVDVTPAEPQNLLEAREVEAEPADRWNTWLDHNV